MEYGCSICGGRPKKIPYGSKKGKFWCSKCDRAHANGVNKKKERQRAKRNIGKELINDPAE